MLVRTAIAIAALLTPVTSLAQTQAIGAARGARGAAEAASASQREGPTVPSQQPARGRAAGTPPPAPQAPAPQAPEAPQAPAAPPEQQGFTYNPEGRRDPFVSLLRRGGATAPGGGQSARPAGLAGLGVNEVTLRGTVQSRDGFVAILQGSDQRTYIVRPGDKLFDGTVRTITQNDMVFLQQVNDPLSLEKQREVRKVLRQTEGQN